MLLPDTDTTHDPIRLLSGRTLMDLYRELVDGLYSHSSDKALAQEICGELDRIEYELETRLDGVNPRKCDHPCVFCPSPADTTTPPDTTTTTE